MDKDGDGLLDMNELKSHLKDEYKAHKVIYLFMQLLEFARVY
jgi:hypothetical protein